MKKLMITIFMGCITACAHTPSSSRVTPAENGREHLGYLQLKTPYANAAWADGRMGGVKKALEQDYHCRAHLSLANIYLTRRDFIRAHHHQAAAEEVIKKYPNICEGPADWVQLTRAQLYLAENEKPKATPILELLHSNVIEKLKVSPSNPELQSLLQEIEVTENTVEEN